MKSLLCVIVVITLGATAGYGAHDLTCYAIIEPGGDYVQADSAIIPKLGIANLGDQAEPDADFFDVEFIVVNEQTSDTVFREGRLVNHIGPYPDSMEVKILPWTPEGICDDNLPFVYYELIGIVCLGQDDENPDNDTVRSNVTCFLSHDVGAIDIDFDPPPNIMPDFYEPGTEITIAVTIENFGMYGEYNIPVRCQIVDRGAHPDTLFYENAKTIDFLDWRGNDSDNPHSCEVVFPPWIAPDLDQQICLVPMCGTELEGDLCPDDDYEALYRNIDPDPCAGVEEGIQLPRKFKLEVLGVMSDGDDCTSQFTVPHTSWVKLDVFDAGGRWVCFIENDIFEPGYYARTWDGCDACGRKVAAGVYLIRMEADEFNAVRKVVIIN